MTSSRPRPSMVATVAAAAATVAVLVACVAASVATLGGLVSTDLFAQSFTGSPDVGTGEVDDTFGGAGPLDGSDADTGQMWTVHTGGFAIVDGQVQAGGGTATATVPSGFANAAVTATFVTVQPRRAGLIVTASADGSEYYAAEWGQQAQGRMRLVRVADGATTVVAEVVGIGTASPAQIRVTHFNGTYRVSIYGTQVISHTVSPADRARFGSNTRHGLRTDDDPRTLIEAFSVVAWEGP